jgi:Transglycosylase
MKPVRAIRLLIILIAALGVVAFVGRNSLLQWVFSHEQARYKSKYHLDIAVDHIKFTSWNNIELSGICVKPEGQDTLVMVKKLEIKPSFLQLLLGRLTIKEIAVDSATITAYNLPERCNLLFLKGDTAINKTPNSKSSYYARAANLKDRLQKFLNTSFQINRLQLNYRDTIFTEQVNIPFIRYDGQRFSGLVINENEADTLVVNVEVTKSNNDIDVLFEHQGKSLCYLPFLDAQHGFKCRFKSVKADLKWEDAGDMLRITPVIVVNDFHINHWRLAKEDVVFPDAKFNGLIKATENGFELDSLSTVTLNHAGFKVFSSYEVGPDTVFALNIDMPETASDTFFHALPGGMFNTLKGISCSGTLAYDLHFKINTRQPDSLEFESQLKRKNFSIMRMGAENYSRICDEFTYDAFSGDQFVRHIIVGPHNPDFTALGSIAPNLPAAIMQSEDPSFMVHRGFVQDAFRESIAQNYKQHRFARGGSTISMQMVKNVFLTRNKTISRKAEEALIVYLIENMPLISKGRILEIYLNIIEWGPNIYGASEASRFYFNKKPSELTLQECIFLAAIIPNPKYFKYQFDKQGEIKPYMSDFFKIIEGRMVMRGYLSPADTVNFVPRVKLRGPALQIVAPADSVAPSSDDVNSDMDN